MYMQGFTSVATAGAESTACLTFLLPAWVLDGRAKYSAACLASLLMGVLVHFLSKVRHDLVCKSRAQAPSARSLLSRATLLALHGAQVLLGYFLMLIAMTYSVELFAMVWVGLTVGYGVFNLQSTPDLNSTDPCCSEGEGYEEDEQQQQQYTMMGGAGPTEKTRLRSAPSSRGDVQLIYMQAPTSSSGSSSSSERV